MTADMVSEVAELQCDDFLSVVHRVRKLNTKLRKKCLCFRALLKKNKFQSKIDFRPLGNCVNIFLCQDSDLHVLEKQLERFTGSTEKQIRSSII